MTYKTSWLVAGAMAAAATAACGPGDDDAASCSGLVAGDLVITEIMANPDGEDTGKEWFEIKNTSGALRDLEGVRLVASKADGTSEKTHTMRAFGLEAGAYIVVGGVLDELKPAYMDYGAGSNLGALNNTAGRLTILCGETEIDRASYEEMTDGIARGFTGAMSPDYQANDDLASWCDASEEYETGSFGSPGEDNMSCGSIMPPGMCDDGGTMRATVPPAAGDLVITEFMPSPDGTDATAEWFEVLVTRDVDLNALGIGKTAADVDATITQPTCARVVAGTYIVFGRSVDPVMNAGLPKVDFLYDTSLATSGSLSLSLGGVSLDDITWASAFTSASSSLDPDSLTTAGNDDANAFCKGVDAYGTLANKGTPGAVNPQCPQIVPPGMCDDGGVVRPIVSPTVGQLVITEFMPDPAAVGDTLGEYFEVLVTASVDLNGLQIGRTSPTVVDTLSSPTCLEVTAGSYVVFAQSDELAMNGGIPMVNFVFQAFSLTNTNSGIFVAVGGVLIDAITYTNSTAGKATQLDPDFTDATGNDTAANFCPTPDANTYGAGDKGTPGAANVQCP